MYCVVCGERMNTVFCDLCRLYFCPVHAWRHGLPAKYGDPRLPGPCQPRTVLVVDALPQVPTYSDHPHGIVGAIVEYLDPELYAERFGGED